MRREGEGLVFTEHVTQVMVLNGDVREIRASEGEESKLVEGGRSERRQEESQKEFQPIILWENQSKCGLCKVNQV